MRPLLLPQLACLLAACATAPETVPPPAAPPPIGCEAARAADFEGAGEQRLRAYLAWLAQHYGGDVALAPSRVGLAVAASEPKPGPAGVQAGEVACNPDSYRVTLYRTALEGRPLAVAYETVAHEFFHLVQIRRDRLDCAPGDGARKLYEREAAGFARELVPACSK
jgi:hypothetical protein